MSGSAQYEVVRGFGDMEDRAECWGIQRYKKRFDSEADAIAFSEQHYDQQIDRLVKTMPGGWKSFWVTVRRVMPSPAAIADKFDAVLREWLSPADYAEMVRLNRTPEYGGNVCASHEFCDSNMAMEEAMESFGIGCDRVGGDDETTTLWNAAWNAWRESKK